MAAVNGASGCNGVSMGSTFVGVLSAAVFWGRTLASQPFQCDTAWQVARHERQRAAVQCARNSRALRDDFSFHSLR